MDREERSGVLQFGVRGFGRKLDNALIHDHGGCSPVTGLNGEQRGERKIGWAFHRGWLATAGGDPKVLTPPDAGSPDWDRSTSVLDRGMQKVEVSEQ